MTLRRELPGTTTEGSKDEIASTELRQIDKATWDMKMRNEEILKSPGPRVEEMKVGASERSGASAQMGERTVKAQVLRWWDEESPQEIASGQGVQLGRHVDEASDHGRGSAEAQNSIQVEGGDLGVVPLIVGEVEVIGQRLLLAWKPGFSVSFLKKGKSLVSKAKTETAKRDKKNRSILFFKEEKRVG